MIKFASIASGSSGNCIVCGCGEDYILIDAGISCKRIVEGLSDLGITINHISAIFITHEHSDHIQGLKVLLKKNPVPVYGSKGTMSDLANKELFDHQLINVISANETVDIGCLKISAHDSYHDTPEPLWFRVDSPEGAVAVVTDIGHTDEGMIKPLSGLSAILMESNHDIGMLEMGPYTFTLKRRIMGANGHLSNEACGQFLCNILHDDIRAIALGHLSKENNYPDLALLTVKNEIDFAPVDFLSKNLNIFVANRDRITRILWD